MNLTYNKINETFELSRGSLNSIVLESADLFKDFLIDFRKQLDKEQEMFALIENSALVDFKKIDLITSPLDLKYDKKIIQKKLFAHIAEELKANNGIDEIFELYSEIISKIDDIKFLSDYRFEYEEQIGISEIFKFFDVKLSNPEGTFAEMFIEYAETVNKLLDKEIFILYNCDVFFNPDDYEYILKWAASYNICVCLVKQAQIRTDNKIKEIIIDNDYCII